VHASRLNRANVSNHWTKNAFAGVFDSLVGFKEQQATNHGGHL